jgi:hypothetical protein
MRDMSGVLREPFPSDDVEACLADEALQGRKAREISDRELDVLAWRRDLTLAEGAPERAEWVWFSAPDHAWASEAGTEGWLLYDRETGEQHAYVETAMS